MPESIDDTSHCSHPHSIGIQTEWLKGENKLHEKLGPFGTLPWDLSVQRHGPVAVIVGMLPPKRDIKCASSPSPPPAYSMMSYQGQGGQRQAMQTEVGGGRQPLMEGGDCPDCRARDTHLETHERRGAVGQEQRHKRIDLPHAVAERQECT